MTFIVLTFGSKQRDTAFGAFWGAEGAGAHWPASDASLLWLAPTVAIYALALVAVLKRQGEHPQSRPFAAATTSASRVEAH